MNKLLFFSYETYIFDFDGTLVLSNDIKREGFFQCVEAFKNGKEIIDNIMNKSKNSDRFSIFNNFSEKISANKDKKNIIYENLLKNYEKYTVEEIIKLKPINGSIKLLNYLKSKKKKIYINSATPLNSLVLTLKGRNIYHYFDKILGMENGKIENLQLIKKHSKSDKEMMLMIGDGKDDFKAAYEYNIKFYPVGDYLTSNRTDYSELF